MRLQLPRERYEKDEITGLRPMLGTYDLLTGRDLYRATHTVT